MQSAQQHIINKLQVEVVTQNTRSAFDLKDNMDGFLKDEILPFLEKYFSSIEEDLQTQVIQIPHLSLDVHTSSTLNYKELKEDVKKAINKELKRVVSEAHPNNEDVKILANESSKENTFLHFLETGSGPWWMKTEEVFELTEEELHEFLQSKSFLVKLQSKLMHTTFRKRIIQQLSNQQISSVLEAVDASRLEKIRPEEFHPSFENLAPTDRKIIWDCILDEVLQKDAELFISRLIFQLTEKLSHVDLEKKVMDKDSKAFMEVLVDILRKSINIPQAASTLKILQANPFLQKELKIQIADFHSFEAPAFETPQESPRSTIQKTDPSVSDGQAVDTSKNVEDSIQPFIKTTREQEISEQEIRLQDSSRPTSENRSETAATSKAAETTKVNSENSKKETQSPIENKEVQRQEKVRNVTKEEVASTKSDVEKVADAKTVANKESNTENPQHPSLSKTQESLHQLIKKEDRTLFEELNKVDQPSTYRTEGEFYINNAGLILLHPYLKNFFQHCELLDDENNITNKDLAVHLLHYLATKQEQQFESNMLFEKVLCGVPVEESIQRTIPISSALKANAEELLEAVLANWGVLKNASPDLLRGEFLQRFGKISFKEENPKITVERKVYDILLDKLPWNIGISRLPWLDYLLFTDW